MLSYDGDLEYVKDDLYGVEVTIVTYVRNSSGTHKVDTQVAKAGTQDAYNWSSISTNLPVLDEDSEVIFELTPVIDYYGEGEQYGTVGQPNGTDDRDQTLVTLNEETWSDRTNSGEGKFLDSYWFASSDKVIESVIKARPDYNDRKVFRDEDGKKVTYSLVYYVNGDEIEAVWEANPEERIVWGAKKAETPVYDELDTNHDGVVSCDEAHGEGWVWNEDKKACVYTGSTTSTVIVNTATK